MIIQSTETRQVKVHDQDEILAFGIAKSMAYKFVIEPVIQLVNSSELV